MTLVGQNGIPGLVELRGVSSVQFEQLQVGIYIYIIYMYHYKLYTKNLKELSFSLHSIVKSKGLTNALKNLDIGGPLEMCQVCKWVTCQ